MRQFGRGLSWTLAMLAIALGVRGLVVLSAPSPGTDAWTARTVASLRWLSDDLEPKSDRMQRLFPEGRVFTAALTGLGWVNVSESDPEIRIEALAHARAALDIVLDDASTQPFGPAGGLHHGMFYHAWSTLLHARVATLAGPDSREASFLAAPCRRLSRAFADSAVTVDSYPGQAWPADAAAGAAALAECGRLVDSRYGRVAESWLDRALATSDLATGLIPHAAGDPQARGSSSVLVTALIRHIDPDRAAEYAHRVDAAFGTRLLGVLPVVREYARGEEGRGDIDSGPIVAGVSAPASVVGIGAALVAGDADRAEGRRAAAELFGIPVSLGGQRRYALAVMPVGDAFLAWASSIPVVETADRSVPFGWRRRWGVAFVLLLSVGVAGASGLWRSRSPAKREL